MATKTILRTFLAIGLIADAAAYAQTSTATVIAPAAPDAPFSFNGSLAVQPIAYDNTSTSGADREDFYFGLIPKVWATTRFRFLNDRILNVVPSYELRFRLYLGEDNVEHSKNAKDYKHNFELKLNADLSDKVGYSMYNQFEYFTISTNEVRNTLWIESDPQLDYRFTPMTSLSLGYRFVYASDLERNIPGNQVDAISNPIFQGDDIGNEPLTLPGTVPIFGDSDLAAAPTNEFFLYSHGIYTKFAHRFNPTRSFDIWYRFARYLSNQDTAETFENWFQANFNQGLWKQATAAARYELRILDSVYSFDDTQTTGQRAFRHRLQLILSQRFSQFLSAEFYYRFQRNIANVAAAEFDYTRFWLGVAVNF